MKVVVHLDSSDIDNILKEHVSRSRQIQVRSLNISWEEGRAIIVYTTDKVPRDVDDFDFSIEGN